MNKVVHTRKEKPGNSRGSMDKVGQVLSKELSIGGVDTPHPDPLPSGEGELKELK